MLTGLTRNAPALLQVLKLKMLLGAHCFCCTHRGLLVLKLEGALLQCILVFPMTGPGLEDGIRTGTGTVAIDTMEIKHGTKNTCS